MCLGHSYRCYFLPSLSKYSVTTSSDSKSYQQFPQRLLSSPSSPDPSPRAQRSRRIHRGLGCRRDELPASCSRECPRDASIKPSLKRELSFISITFSQLLFSTLLLSTFLRSCFLKTLKKIDNSGELTMGDVQ